MKKITLSVVALVIAIVAFVFMFIGCGTQTLPKNKTQDLINQGKQLAKNEYIQERQGLINTIEKLEKKLATEKTDRKIIIVKKVREDRTAFIEMLKKDIDILKDKIDEYK